MNSNAVEILRALKSDFHIVIEEFASLKIQRAFEDAFKVLIVTVLSQNTNDKNALEAFQRLEATIGVDPKRLASAKVASIKDAIRVGGLYHAKARAIKHLANEVLERFKGDMNQILARPLDEARKILMSLPKVGPKTADVVLVTVGGRPTIPVDTHVDRVSKRLGLAPPKGGYEDVRNSLQSLFPQDEYHTIHLLLIAHGRKYCKARRPLCYICPIEKFCSYPNKILQP